MAQRFARSLTGRVRENPLGFLYFVLALSAEIVALWLYPTWNSSGTDVNRPVVAQAITILGVTFWLAMVWSLLFNGTRAEHGAPSLEGSRVLRPSARVQRIAFSVWVMIFILALAQLVTALSGNRGVALPLGYAVGWLELIVIIGGVVLLVAVARRQR
jgi:hypothetical protein